MHSIVNWISPAQQPALNDLSHIVTINKIDTDQFYNDLYSIEFVSSPGGTASELYDQNVDGLTHLLDKPAPDISRMAKKQLAKMQSAEWLSDSFLMACSLSRQFEWMWRKHKAQPNR